MSISEASLLEAIYRGVLGRTPDPGGFALHLANLGVAPGVDHLAQTLRAFLDSDEYRVLQAGRQPVGPELLGGPLSDSAPYAHVASLGSHCYASWILKQMGLKRYTLPFDWIFSNVPTVMHCIQDNFATFLDRRYYRPTPLAKRMAPEMEVCGHEYYDKTFRVRMMFNHYDPTEPARYAYLRRSVGRMHRLLDSPARKLLVVATVAMPDNLAARQFFDLARLLDRRSQNAELLVVRILPASGHADVFGCRVVETLGGHRLLALQPTSTMRGIEFDQRFDDFLVRRLLSLHRFELQSSI